MLRQLLRSALLIACAGGAVVSACAADETATSARGPLAKRVGPPKVAPVVVGKLKVVVLPWGKDRGLGQNGGYVAILDADTGKELRLVKVYEVRYEERREGDLQDVFIAAMSKSLFSDKLSIADEKGRKYTLDPETGVVEAR